MAPLNTLERAAPEWKVIVCSAWQQFSQWRLECWLPHMP